MRGPLPICKLARGKLYVGFGRGPRCSALGGTDIPRAQHQAPNLINHMGDRSPKANQKKSSQETAAGSSSAAKKSQAIADKQAAPGKKR